MAWGQVHSVLSQGTAGSFSAGPYVRLNTFQFGVGTQGYGPSPSYYSVVQPVSSGGGNGPGSFGSTAGCVYYAHKAAAGPSMISFTGGFGVTSTFVDFTNKVWMAPGLTKGITALHQAIDYYGTLGGGETVVSNRFKTIPQIDNLILYFDVDQWMCIRPSDLSLTTPRPDGKELSSNYSTFNHIPSPPTNASPFLSGYPNPLPWYVEFNSGGTIDLGYFDFNSPGFLVGKKDFTVSYWIKFLAVPPSQVVQFNHIDVLSNYVYTYAEDDGFGNLRIGALVYDGTTSYAVSYTPAPSGWMLVTLTGNQDALELWINDTLVDDTPYGTGPTFDAPLDTTFGVASPDQSFQLNSLLVWNTYPTPSPGADGSFFKETTLEFG
jgi:hypothetical protein